MPRKQHKTNMDGVTYCEIAAAEVARETEIFSLCGAFLSIVFGAKLEIERNLND